VNAVAAQNSADRRTEDKPETEHRAEKSHALGARFLRGDVGDIGLRGRNVAARDAGDYSPAKTIQSAVAKPMKR
jgi:hypothetical protein